MSQVFRSPCPSLRTLLSANSRGNAPLVRLALLGFAFGIALLSCGRDVTSPGANVRYARGIAWHAQFPPAYQLAGVAAAGVVDFNRVRVVLHRADGTVALDTVIDYPAGADSILISLSVQLLPSAPSSGEPLSLNLAYINAAGDTVFKGGPVGVTAVPSVPGQPPPPSVTVPVSYTGPGANAVGVQISPRSGTAVSGSSFNFTAVAVDQNGVAIANTPIVWNSLDPSIASIPSAASGTVLAGSTRGTARIVAQLLTGPTDQVTLNVLPLPTTIALQSGSGQTGLVGNSLANPLVALVTAADGIGVGGVTVTFAVASGGGSVGTATVVTDGAGLAQTTWKLGSTAGTQTVTASSGTLTGSPVTFTATARSLAPTKLAVTAQPANATAGATLATVTIVAQTASGDPASAFTGAVTLTLAGGTSGATLGGTTTVNAVGGVATFSNLTVSRSGTSYSLVASSSGLTNATTNSFDIAAGPLATITVSPNPSNLATGGTQTFTAVGKDVNGNIVVIVPAWSVVNATAGSINGSTGLFTAGTVSGTYLNTVQATSGGISGFATVNVAIGALATITVTPNPVSLNVNLTQQFTAIGKDASGNVVALTPVWSVAAGGGTISSSGLFVAGTVIGTFANTVTATSGGLSGTATVIVTGGGIASTTVTTPATKLDTLTSIGDVFTVVATAKNALNNVVAGSYTFLSRNPAVATVNATTGVVTAVTNGSTYVIATEAGGTKDSALFVVQQRVATINVTPGNKNIYLGATFAFTAQAVDGRSNPLTVQPTFTWTSTDNSVATVNSSGLVTSVDHGATQIRATANSITGVSSVNIITAIQHIYVVRDSVGFSTTSSDVFNMAALGLHRAYKAYAYDTLNVLMPSVTTFTWASSNPSVALLDTTQALRADALSAANGTTSIQATAQGFTGSATLNVAQVLASISLTPASPSIQPTGSVSLTARGKDSNGQFIAGGTFTWTSLHTGIATVSSSSPTTGLVTGVALGTDSVTANIGSIVSAPDPVIVQTSVPAALSFGRDTVSVGRGSNTQVPILLSRPSTTTTTLLLTVADTFAFWSSTKVVVPAGQTSINAQLNGHNAGNTTITVTDSAAVYAPSTSMLAVQATMHLTSGSYALNATDQVSTQVLLSDPSPAGGTFVTFSYGTNGIASVSPSPAFIPIG